MLIIGILAGLILTGSNGLNLVGLHSLLDRVKVLEKQVEVLKRRDPRFYT